MIIIGIDECTHTTGAGAFHCPHCGADRVYRQLCRGQYFTLFCLPVVLLNELTEQVICENCCWTFDKSALLYNPEMERQERAEQVKLVMILTLLQRDRVSETAMRAIREAYHDESGSELSTDDIEEDLEEARQLDMDPLIELIRLSQKIQPQGALTVLRYAFLAASADGPSREGTNNFLQELREALGVSETAFRRIVTAVTQDIAK